MNNKTACDIFRQTLKGKNMMTPEILEYDFTSKGLAYELSTGRDFNNRKIFGVTFLTKDGDTCHDINQLFYNKDEAYSYIAEN